MSESLWSKRKKQRKALEKKRHRRLDQGEERRRERKRKRERERERGRVDVFVRGPHPAFKECPATLGPDVSFASRRSFGIRIRISPQGTSLEVCMANQLERRPINE